MCDWCSRQEDGEYSKFCHERLRDNCVPVHYLKWKYGSEAIEKFIEDSLKR